MPVSKVICFRPWKNLIWDSSICVVNSPDVVTVARMVSPGCIKLFWSSRIGWAEITGRIRISRSAVLYSILFGHVSESLKCF